MIMNTPGRLVPIEGPTVEDVLSIPMNSEVVVFNGDGVACVPWVQENLDAAVRQLAEDADHDRFTELWMYLPPHRAPQAAIDQVLLEVDLGGRLANADGLADALGSGWLGGKDLHQILTRIAQAAQS